MNQRESPLNLPANVQGWEKLPPHPIWLLHGWPRLIHTLYTYICFIVKMNLQTPAWSLYNRSELPPLAGFSTKVISSQGNILSYVRFFSQIYQGVVIILPTKVSNIYLITLAWLEIYKEIFICRVPRFQIAAISLDGTTVSFCRQLTGTPLQVFCSE